MDKHSHPINKLVHDALTGQLTDEGKSQLQAWLNASPHNRARYERLCQSAGFTEKYRRYAAINDEEAWQAFRQSQLPKRSIVWKRVLKYAAILMLPILGIAVWLTLELTQSQPATAELAEVKAVMEKSEQTGHQKAVLTLGNGKRVKLAPQSAPLSISDIQIEDEEVEPFPATDSQSTSAEEDNSLVTYKDSEYWLTLEDGTRIHLNYNTTLRYPTHFGSGERTVYLEGEAYFQVAKDRKRPFRVITPQGTIQQYGTSFNVNTYAPGETKVVLVEGSIGVTLTGSTYERRIHPGELAVLQTSNSEVNISRVNVEQYVAWHNGHFVFDGCTLEELMDVISRWYGKEIIYESDYIKTMHFTGDLDRYSSILPLMKAIENLTGVQIIQDNNKLILREVKP